MSLAEADLKDSARSPIESEVRSLLNRVSNFLVEHNVKSYVVGGWVRDVLLGRDTADIDIAVTADALEIASAVATALDGRYVRLDEIRRIGRVVLADKAAPSTRAPRVLDFSTITGSIEQDLAQRDFTIDAMALEVRRIIEHLHSPPASRKKDAAPLHLPEIIDPFHGRDDLHQGVIRVVAETAFTADAARLLRAVRLAAELDFSIEPKTESLIRRDSSLITRVAGERVREELLRLLAMDDDGQLLPYLDDLGLLTTVFPELTETKGVTQPKEHFWNVFEHSLKTVPAVDFLLQQGDWEYAGEEILAAVPWSVALAQHFDQEVSSGSTRRVLLKLAALLHDIRKPQTKTLDNGRLRFLGHALEGATVSATMLERLRFSSKEIKLVATEIRYHLRPVQMSQGELPTRRAIYRYFRDCAEAGIDILFLSLADHLASQGPHLELAAWREHAQLIDYVINQRSAPETPPVKLVDGHDLIRLLALSPGPKIGEILEAVREAQAAGEITSREEALAYIARLKDA